MGYENSILQSNYGLRLKKIILNGILYAILSYNAVVSYSPDNPVDCFFSIVTRNAGLASRNQEPKSGKRRQRY